MTELYDKNKSYVWANLQQQLDVSKNIFFCFLQQTPTTVGTVYNKQKEWKGWFEQKLKSA